MAIKVGATSDFYNLTASLPNILGPITVMHWFKFPSNPAGSAQMVNLCTDPQFRWYTIISGTGLYRWADNAGGGACGTTTVGTGAWHSVGFTINAANTTVLTYVDGVTDNNTGSLTASVAPTDLRIGASKGGDLTTVDFEFYGLKIWNAELSGADMTSENGSYTPVTNLGSIYAYWLLTSADATISDGSGNGHTLTKSGSWTTSTDPPPLGGGGGGLMWL